MTTVAAPTTPRIFPTRSEVTELLTKPAVMITAIITAGGVVGAVLWVLYSLIMAGKPTEAITAFIGGTVVAGILRLLGKTSELQRAIRERNGKDTG